MKFTGFVLSLLFLLVTSFSAMAQKDKKKIKFAADVIEGSKPLGGKETRRLLGHVVFTQDSLIMYCDSAHLFSDNSLDAFAHVHIKQGDSLNLFGDLLKYDGNKRFAKLEKNIRLIDKGMTLQTEHMTYEVGSKTATYIGGGVIHSEDNVLTSETGYYFASGRTLAFKRKVVLTNPKYVVNSDTLHYTTSNKVAWFYGPTWIRSKTNTIYCENGFYDTAHDLAQFKQHAFINSSKQNLKGDSIFYDRKKGFGKALGNIVITDTSQHLIVTGDYSTHNELTNVSYVTGHALLQQQSKKDTLFLHADSLKAVALTDSAALLRMRETHRKKGLSDEIARDSVPLLRTMYAYHKVKFFQSQLQGKCDSLVYVYSDSTMHLFQHPILWSSDNQMTGEFISISTANGEINLLTIINAAFIISKEDSLRFNQIKGKNLTGYFYGNKLRKVYVEGNGQTIYYAKEKNKRTGVNKADCTDMLIFLKDNQVERISLLNKPDGTMYPPQELDPKELRLKDFKDRTNQRPKKLADIFIWESPSGS